MPVVNPGTTTGAVQVVLPYAAMQRAWVIAAASPAAYWPRKRAAARAFLASALYWYIARPNSLTPNSTVIISIAVIANSTAATPLWRLEGVPIRIPVVL